MAECVLSVNLAHSDFIVSLFVIEAEQEVYICIALVYKLVNFGILVSVSDVAFYQEVIQLALI